LSVWSLNVVNLFSAAVSHGRQALVVVFDVTDVQRQNLSYTMSRHWQSQLPGMTTVLMVCPAVVHDVPVRLYRTILMTVPWDILHGFHSLHHGSQSMRPMFMSYQNRRIFTKP